MDRRGVCRAFLHTGQCRFGSSCKFMHQSDFGTQAQYDGLGASFGGQPQDPMKIMRMLANRSLSQERDKRMFIQAAWDACHGGSQAEVFQVLLDSNGSGIERLREVCGAGLIPSAVAGDQKFMVSFQRVVIPFIRLITCDTLKNSPLTSMYNRVLTICKSNMTSIEAFPDFLGYFAAKKSIEDPSFHDPPGMIEKQWVPTSPWNILSVLIKLYSIFLEKFRTDEIQLLGDIEKAIRPMKDFSAAFRSPEGGSADNTGLNYDIEKLRSQINFRRGNFKRGGEILEQAIKNQELEAHERNLFPVNQADVSQAPGHLRSGGKRHSNDDADIHNINIAPTPDEVLCNLAPFLPVNRAGDPSYPIPGAAYAHRDLHFRLLRHDLVAPMCLSVHRFLEAGGVKSLEDKQSRFSTRGDREANEVNMHIYRNARIVSFEANKYAGVYYMIEFDDVPWLDGKKRQHREFWWSRSRRLSHGTLVCLWIDNTPKPILHFGVIARRRPEDLAGPDQIRPKIGIRLTAKKGQFDEKFINSCITGEIGYGKEVVLLQAGPSYFAYEPILRALRTSNIPLQKYITAHARRGSTENVRVEHPNYIQSGIGKAFDFSCILSKDNTDEQRESRVLLENVNLSKISERVVRSLAQSSTLDYSQAAAVIAGLTRELALIQGPPGTGKTFLGIQLVKLLIENFSKNQRDRSALGPILCVCYTNHALDQFLKGLLDSGIENLVRVGGRSKSEEVQRYNLKNKTFENSTFAEKSLLTDAKCRIERLESVIRDLGASLYNFKKADVLQWADIEEAFYLEMPHFEQSLGLITDIPGFEIFSRRGFKRELWGYWMTQKPSSLKKHSKFTMRTLMRHAPPEDASFFASSNDMQERQPERGTSWLPATAEVALEANGASSNLSHLSVCDISSITPEQFSALDQRDRDIAELLNEQEVWLMSRKERRKIHDHCKELSIVPMMRKLESEMNFYEDIKADIREIEDQMGLTVLQRAEIVGMTTSGVAAHQKLVDALAPKVVVVEEAAEVLEAHILVSLSESTEHLILIGDHEQLRPKTDQYELKVESRKGFNLDLSLFERLIGTLKFPCATLETQRRMRPIFSRLIKETIYPNLRNYFTVEKYPHVPGVKHNLFFLDHDHPEQGGGDEGKSKSNDFEVKFSVAFARYLTQQGSYDPDDITIITPYVGQLLKIKQEADSFSLQVVVNEKDRENLIEIEETDVQDNDKDNYFGNQTSAKRTVWTKPTPTKSPRSFEKPGVVSTSLKEFVRIATIDNFQGEESKVIILSLVRNRPKGNIGFVAVRNRINVLLSRAKHGMYILGNAESLKASNSKMWHHVLSILEEENAIGPAIQLTCQKHPGTSTMVSKPEDFTRVQDGGCEKNCTFRLACGHSCPRMCHSDDPQHNLVQCQEICKRGLEPCGHACENLCCEPCGPCNKLIEKVKLPCMHEAEWVKCSDAQNPGTIKCMENIVLELPACGHKHEVPCHREAEFLKDPVCSVLVEVEMPVCKHRIQVKCGELQNINKPELCTAVCGCLMACGHECFGTCGRCIERTVKEFYDLEVQHANGSLPPRTEWEARMKHAECPQICNRTMFCGHSCRASCHGGKPCPPCEHPCTLRCKHSQCGLRCWEPCSPCPNPCNWTCMHRGQCRMLCGAPCDRLPCDQRCSKKLQCGCQCPSLCGEICPPPKFCPKHGKYYIKQQEVDLVLMRTYESMSQEDINSDPLVVLECGHVFTTSTMDGIMDLASFYRKEEDRWVEPLPMNPSFQSQKTCPTCRTAIRGIYRYGRIINKTIMDLTELHFTAMSQSFLRIGETHVKRAEDFAEQVHSQGFKESDDTIRISIEAKNQADEACHTFLRIHEAFQNHPRMELFKRTRALLLNLGSQNHLKHHLQLLDVPQPDQTIVCRAGIGVGLSAKAWIAGSAAHLYALSALEPREREAQERYMYALNSELDGSNNVYSFGMHCIEESISSSKDAGSTTSLLFGYQAIVQLALQMTQHLNQQARNPCTHIVYRQDHYEYQRTVVNRQKIVLGDALRDGKKALHIIDDFQQKSKDQSFQQQRQSIQDLVNEAEKNMTEVLSDGIIDVIWAVLKADPRISEATFGQGHIYRCPRGHVYIIGECGLANQASRCPECGSLIGGTNHGLAPGNITSNDLAVDIRRRQAGAG